MCRVLLEEIRDRKYSLIRTNKEHSLESYFLQRTERRPSKMNLGKYIAYKLFVIEIRVKAGINNKVNQYFTTYR